MKRAMAIGVLLAGLVRPDFALADEADAGAQEVDAGVQTEHWGSERVLGGHTFQYPSLTQSAFLSSTLNFQVLMAFNSSRATSIDSGGTVDVQQIAPVLNLDLTLHVADPVSVFFGTTGAVSSGVSTKSLVLKGETLSYTLTGGVIVRLLRDERTATQIALRAGGLFASGTSINLQGLVDILQGNSGITIDDIVNGSVGDVLLTPFNTYEGNFSGALAHAFSHWLSLQTSLVLKFTAIDSSPYVVMAQERQSESQFIFTPAAAFALTFDANDFHVPLALQLEYRLGISWSTADSTTTSSFGNAFDLGLFYSGRTDLQVGAVFLAFIGVPPIGVFGPGSPGQTHDGFGSVLSMRYVW
jgi:hypothetical protein